MGNQTLKRFHAGEEGNFLGAETGIHYLLSSGPEGIIKMDLRKPLIEKY